MTFRGSQWWCYTFFPKNRGIGIAFLLSWWTKNTTNCSTFSNSFNFEFWIFLWLFFKHWPSLGGHLFDHLLWSIFQSSIPYNDISKKKLTNLLDTDFGFMFGCQIYSICNSELSWFNLLFVAISFFMFVAISNSKIKKARVHLHWL